MQIVSGLLIKIKIKETLNLTNELKKPSTKIEQRGRLNKIKLVLFQGAKAPKRNSNSKFNGKHKLRVKRHKQQCVRHVSFKKTAKKEEKQLLGDVFLDVIHDDNIFWNGFYLCTEQLYIQNTKQWKGKRA